MAPGNPAGGQQAAGGQNPAAAQNAGQGPKSKSKLKPKSGGSNIVSMMLLIFVPWLLFLLIMATYIFYFHHHHLVTIFTLFGGVMLSIGLITLSLTGGKGQSAGGRQWYGYLGIVCMIATFAGAILGFYCYHSYVFQFNSYEERRMYANVLASEPASTKVDAGKMVFSADARVDISKSVGFKHGSFYCVAPILDEDMDTRVEYWAAGVDCCSYRGDFNCDDAWDPKARSGAVIFEDSSELIASERPFFVKARQEAEAAYNLASTDDAIFLKWTRDPDAVQDQYWKSAMGFLAFAVCVYLVVSILFGVGLAFLSSSKK